MIVSLRWYIEYHIESLLNQKHQGTVSGGVGVQVNRRYKDGP